MTGMARFGIGGPFAGGGVLIWTTLSPASVRAPRPCRARARRGSRCSNGPIMIALSPAFSPASLNGFDAERRALRLLLRADIAAAERRDHLRHRHVLVHHLDAGLATPARRAA